MNSIGNPKRERGTEGERESTGGGGGDKEVD